MNAQRSGAERRTFERHIVDREIIVEIAGHRLHGRLVDVSNNGAFINLEVAIEVGDEVVEVGAMLRVGEQRFECLVYDLSPGGARVKLREPRDLDVGTEVALQLAELDKIASEVRHSQGGVLGLMFLHDSDQHVQIASYMLAQRLAIPHASVKSKSKGD